MNIPILAGPLNWLDLTAWPEDPNSAVKVIVRKPKPVPSRFETQTRGVMLWGDMINEEWIDLSKWPEDPNAPNVSKRIITGHEDYFLHLGLKIL